MSDVIPRQIRDSDGAVGTALATRTDITVVVCAYTEQRWDILAEACRAVRDQLSPGDELVVVIDHNDRLLDRAQAGLPGARVLPNTAARGLSGARNTGVSASGKGIVVFLDDDAVPRPGWLTSIRAVFARADEVAVVGTRVLPRWQGERAPAWFPEEFGWVVGCGYRGQPTTRAAIRNPIGASMAVRRHALARAGGFSAGVGRVGTLPVGCEETEFCIRLAQREPRAAIVFTPDAAVDHFVPAQRQTLRYFLSRCYHEGRSKRAVARLRGRERALSAERAYVKVTLPAAVARGLSPRALRRDPAATLKALAVVAGLCATVWGYAVPGARA